MRFGSRKEGKHLRKRPLLRDPCPSPPNLDARPALICCAWCIGQQTVLPVWSHWKECPQRHSPASPSFSSAALTSPLRCHCRKRSSLRGRRRATSSPAAIDHPKEEPFCSLGRASCTATGASGRMCIRSSWGKSRRNTWRGDVLGSLAPQPTDLGIWVARLASEQKVEVGMKGSCCQGLRDSLLGAVACLSLVQCCSVLDAEPGSPNFRAHQNHPGTCYNTSFSAVPLLVWAGCVAWPWHLHL